MALIDLTKSWVPTVSAVAMIAFCAVGYSRFTGMEQNQLAQGKQLDSFISWQRDHEKSIQTRIDQQGQRDLAQDRLINDNATQWGVVGERLRSIDDRLERIERNGNGKK